MWLRHEIIKRVVVVLASFWTLGGLEHSLVDYVILIVEIVKVTALL
jgi:hypothetical protein